MKKINQYILGLGLLVLSLSAFTSCEEETEPATSYATTNQMQRSSAATEALLSAIPSSLNTVWDRGYHYSWGYGSIMKIRDVMTADEALSERAYNQYAQWIECSGIGRDYAVTQFIWNYFYKMVLTTNNLILAVDPGTATTQQLGYLGAAYAFRAMFYLDMARMYEFLPNEKFPDGKNSDGNVVTNLTCPIVKAGMSKEDARKNPRATREDMKKFIEGDLNNAEQNIDKLTDTRDNTLPDKACVYGLKARLYMWVEDYAKAEEYAKMAIAAAKVTPVTKADALNPTTGFNTTAPWMWGSNQTADAATVKTAILNWTSWMSNETTFGYNGAGAVHCMIGKELYDRISDTDWRKLYWKAPASSPLAGQVPYLKASYKTALSTYASIKFRPGQGNDGEPSVAAACAYPLMRVEEMYFIEAEAAAQQNKLADAKTVLNNIMQTRDANYNCLLTDKDAIIEEIVFQKRVELWGEGQSFFDIKRLNYSVKRGYAGTNFYELGRYNTNGRPAWMNLCIVITEENNNSAVKGYNNPDPSSRDTPYIK